MMIDDDMMVLIITAIKVCLEHLLSTCPRLHSSLRWKANF